MVKIYVLDTNVLIQAPHAVECFEDNQVILPMVVLEELDRLKKAEGDRGSTPDRRLGSWNSSGKRETCFRVWKWKAAELCV